MNFPIIRLCSGLIPQWPGVAEIVGAVSFDLFSPLENPIRIEFIDHSMVVAL